MLPKARIAAVLLAVGLALAPSLAFAQDDAAARTAETHAADIAAAHADGADSLDELIRDGEFHPWLVLELLCARGAFDAAEAFVATRAAPSPGESDGSPFERYLAMRREAGAGEGMAAWETLQKSEGLRGQGRLDEAQAALDAGPEPPRSVLGVELLRSQAWVLQNRRRHPEAVAQHRKAAELALEIEHEGKAAQCLRDAASLQIHMNAFPGVVSDATRALEIERKWDYAPGIAMCQQQIATALNLMGRPVEARAAALEAVDLQKSLPLTGNSVFASVTLLQVHRATGEISEAIAVGERAVTLAEEFGHPYYLGIALSNLATVYHDAGLEERAVETVQRQIETIDPSNIDARVLAQANLGWGQHNLGQWAQAMTTLLDAVERSSACAFPSAPIQARQNLAALYTTMGRDKDAEPLFREAVAFADRARMVGYRSFLQVALGRTLFRLGQPEEATELLTEARTNAEMIGDWATAGNALGVLAHFGEHDPANVEPHRRALEFGLRAQNDQLVAKARYHLIHALLASGNAGEAHEIADEWVNGLLEGGTFAQRFDALFARAVAAARLGRTEEALADTDAAMALLVGVLSGLDTESSGGAARDLSQSLQVAVELAASQADAARVLRYTEMLRAASLSSVLDQRGRMRNRRVTADLRQREAIARKRLQLAESELATAMRAGKLGAIRTARSAVDDAVRGLRDTVADIRRQTRLAAGVTHPDPRPLDEVQATLAEGDAAVIYARSDTELFDDTRKLLALVITPAEVRMVELGEVSRGDAGIDPRTAAADPEARAAHAKRYVEPLGLDSSVKRVIVSPVGELAYLPFAAIDPDRSYVHTPSMTAYLEFMEAATAPGETVLAVADPEYGGGTTDGSRGRATLRGLRFKLSPLPGTREEAVAIADETLLGPDATETNVRERLGALGEGRLRSLHFACHGLVDAEHPMNSALALTEEEGQDGNLTALEIGDLVAPADLVALSACDTALGKVFDGTGVVGFTTTFLAAGADRVLCSLWKVDDAATSALMKRFYELWNHDDPAQRLTASDALREAQAFVRGHEEWKDPVYWAAWQLWGAGDRRTGE